MHRDENVNHMHERILRVQVNLFKLALITFVAVSFVVFGARQANV